MSKKIVWKLTSNVFTVNSVVHISDLRVLLEQLQIDFVENDYLITYNFYFGILFYKIKFKKKKHDGQAKFVFRFSMMTMIYGEKRLKIHTKADFACSSKF